MNELSWNIITFVKNAAKQLDRKEEIDTRVMPTCMYEWYLQVWDNYIMDRVFQETIPLTSALDVD